MEDEEVVFVENSSFPSQVARDGVAARLFAESAVGDSNASLPAALDELKGKTVHDSRENRSGADGAGDAHQMSSIGVFSGALEDCANSVFESQLGVDAFDEIEDGFSASQGDSIGATNGDRVFGTQLLSSASQNGVDEVVVAEEEVVLPVDDIVIEDRHDVADRNPLGSGVVDGDNVIFADEEGLVYQTNPETVDIVIDEEAAMSKTAMESADEVIFANEEQLLFQGQEAILISSSPSEAAPSEPTAPSLPPPPSVSNPQPPAMPPDVPLPFPSAHNLSDISCGPVGAGGPLPSVVPNVPITRADRDANGIIFADDDPVFQAQQETVDVVIENDPDAVRKKKKSSKAAASTGVAIGATVNSAINDALMDYQSGGADRGGVVLYPGAPEERRRTRANPGEVTVITEGDTIKELVAEFIDHLITVNRGKIAIPRTYEFGDIGGWGTIHYNPCFPPSFDAYQRVINPVPRREDFPTTGFCNFLSCRGYCLPSDWENLIDADPIARDLYNLGAFQIYARKLDPLSLDDPRDEPLYTQEMSVNDVYYSFLAASQQRQATLLAIADSEFNAEQNMRGKSKRNKPIGSGGDFPESVNFKRVGALSRWPLATTEPESDNVDYRRSPSQVIPLPGIAGTSVSGLETSLTPNPQPVSVDKDLFDMNEGSSAPTLFADPVPMELEKERVIFDGETFELCDEQCVNLFASVNNELVLHPRARCTTTGDCVPFRHSTSYIAPQSKALAVQKLGKSSIPLNPAVIRNLDRIICKVKSLRKEHASTRRKGGEFGFISLGIIRDPPENTEKVLTHRTAYEAREGETRAIYEKSNKSPQPQIKIEPDEVSYLTPGEDGAREVDGASPLTTKNRPRMNTPSPPRSKRDLLRKELTDNMHSTPQPDPYRIEKPSRPPPRPFKRPPKTAMHRERSRHSMRLRRQTGSQGRTPSYREYELFGSEEEDDGSEDDDDKEFRVNTRKVQRRIIDSDSDDESTPNKTKSLPERGVGSTGASPCTSPNNSGTFNSPLKEVVDSIVSVTPSFVDAMTETVTDAFETDVESVFNAVSEVEDAAGVVDAPASNVAQFHDSNGVAGVEIAFVAVSESDLDAISVSLAKKATGEVCDQIGFSVDADRGFDSVDGKSQLDTQTSGAEASCAAASFAEKSIDGTSTTNRDENPAERDERQDGSEDPPGETFVVISENSKQSSTEILVPSESTRGFKTIPSLDADEAVVNGEIGDAEGKSDAACERRDDDEGNVCFSNQFSDASEERAEVSDEPDRDGKVDEPLWDKAHGSLGSGDVFDEALKGGKNNDFDETLNGQNDEHSRDESRGKNEEKETDRVNSSSISVESMEKRRSADSGFEGEIGGGDAAPNLREADVDVEGFDAASETRVESKVKKTRKGKAKVKEILTRGKRKLTKAEPDPTKRKKYRLR